MGFGNRRRKCKGYSTKIPKGNSGRTLSKEPKKESYKRGTKAGKHLGSEEGKGIVSNRNYLISSSHQFYKAHCCQTTSLRPSG